MQLKTYTGLWNVESRLYKFYDIKLPFPIPVRQLGIAFLTFIPWFLFMHLIKFPIHPPIGPILWFVPPGFLTWWSDRPVAEGKKLFDFLSSQMIYFFGNKTYATLIPTKIDTPPVIIKGTFWHKAKNI